LLKKAYLPCSIDEFVIISDRDKGLAPAIENILPNIVHAKCYYHIKDNLVNSLISLSFLNNLRLIRFKATNGFGQDIRQLF
jgi:hypothetical protein